VHSFFPGRRRQPFRRPRAMQFCRSDLSLPA
jgi:hypothetical protein